MMVTCIRGSGVVLYIVGVLVLMDKLGAVRALADVLVLVTVNILVTVDVSRIGAYARLSAAVLQYYTVDKFPSEVY